MKTVAIGIDGVPYDMIKGFAKDGVMPCFAELIDQYEFRKMESAIPEISSVSWSSIITGDNPGEHGIYGFTDFLPGTYNLSFPNFNNLKTKPYWEKDGKRHVVINVPMTYPAKPLNGFMVSGFVAPDLEKAVYPPEYLSKLQELDYRTDVDASKAKKSESLFLTELNEALENRIKTYQHFWQEPWQTFTLVFTGSDRLEHVLWNAYEDKEHEFHEDFLNYFRRVDEVIGEISSSLSEEDQLVLMSDHGMERVDKEVNINHELEQQDFLSFEDSKKLKNISQKTQAFALDPSRIYINKKDSFSRGKINEKEAEEISDSLFSFFKKQEYVKKVFRKKEIYHGKEINNSPDIILLPRDHYNFRARMADGLYSQPALSGHHTQDDAFLLVKNGIPKENPKVEDVSDFILGEKR